MVAAKQAKDAGEGLLVARPDPEDTGMRSAADGTQSRVYDDVMSETLNSDGDAAAEAAEAIAALDLVTRRLRRECPWDRKQDERSIVPHTVEEAYELADAAMSGDDAEMLDELGDVLFQVHFLSLLLEERGVGSLAEVARNCREKLIRRHPHVYKPASRSEPTPGTPDEVLANWDRIKTDVEGRGSGGPFSDVPENLPALLHARKAQRRAASRLEGESGLAGTPGEAGRVAAGSALATGRAAGRALEEAADGAVASAAEEAAERTQQAMELVEAGADGSTDTGAAEREAVTDAIGKALFALVDLARQVKVDPELALRAETARFMADCAPELPPPDRSSGEPVNRDSEQEGAS